MDRRRRLDIDNDRVLDIDQIVVRIGKERYPAVRRGPPRRRIGRCNELGCDLGCGPERGIIENGQILLDRAACRVPRQTRGTFNTGAVAGIGLDQAGIDGESFAADEAFGDAALQYSLEQSPQQIAVAETAQ